MEELGRPRVDATWRRGPRGVEHVSQRAMGIMGWGRHGTRPGHGGIEATMVDEYGFSKTLRHGFTNALRVKPVSLSQGRPHCGV